MRQLCWRDFYHQVLHAFPALPTQAYRAGAVENWRDDADALEAWQDGQHRGAHRGRRHAAARDGGLDAQPGPADHRVVPDQAPRPGLAGRRRALFDALLLDGDVANNYGNWQWVAGTGNDTKPYRRFNPIRQADASTPTATTCAGTSPSWVTSGGPRSTGRGSCPESTIRRRWRVSNR